MGSKTGNKFFYMTQDAGSPGPAIKEIVNWACNMRVTVERGCLKTDGETIGSDFVRAHVVQVKK